MQENTQPFSVTAPLEAVVDSDEDCEDDESDGNHEGRQCPTRCEGDTVVDAEEDIQE